MTPAKWIGVVLAIFVSLGSAHAQDLSSVATEDLISKLQDESDQGIGIHETASLSGFMAINDAPRFDGGIIEPYKVTTSSAMSELVRRGAAALPVLIAHLSDARPTKLIVDQGMSKWFGKEYDPRDRDPAKLPPGVEGPSAHSGGIEARQFGQYTVKVGDVCFVAVGQIVNRHLNAVRYQPSMCLVVNSPVETPALAAAVKADWGGLTPADHRRSLEEDALHPSSYGLAPEAVKRLMYYYPEAGTPVAVRLLQSPLCDTALVIDFLEESLLKETDVLQQDRLMAQFRKEYGETNYRAMQLSLISFSASSEYPSAESAREKIISSKILARAFPGIDSKHPPLSAGTDFQEMHDLADALAAFPSQAIDKAVYDLLKRTAATQPFFDSVQERCELVHSCALRLTKPGDRVAFEKSYRRVMSAFPRGLEPKKLTAFAIRFQAYLDVEMGKLAPKA